MTKEDEFKSFVVKLADKLKDDKEDIDTSFAAHYGIPHDEFDKTVLSVVGKSFMADQWSDQLDKMFPELDNEGRSRVAAFAIGFSIRKDIDSNKWGKR